MDATAESTAGSSRALPPDRAASGAVGDGSRDPFRERSPRRQPSSSTKASPTAAAAGAHSFFPDRAGVLNGLVARPELNGSLVEVLAYDPGRERHHVRVRSSGEQVWVRGENVAACS